ncbi:Ku protein [Saccharopolyspora hattusasensis]|uniref:Ku protein n=1 Tax=Saccharopolyspora hattusasensis TaxID=1128679 RepID=UPI003D972106
MQLFSATEDHTIRFHQIQRGTAARVRHKRVNERTGDEVPTAEIVKGYPTEHGWVVVEPKELEDIAPGRSRSLEIAGFVDLDDIDPIDVRGTRHTCAWLVSDRTRVIAGRLRTCPAGRVWLRCRSDQGRDCGGLPARGCRRRKAAWGDRGRIDRLH